LACLMLGDFAKGWRDYEFRWKARQKKKPEFNAPEWRGDPLEGRSLLLHTEQGFGDSIMFLRFARQLARARNRISLQCQPQLKRLFAGVPELDSVVAPGDALPAFDVHAPLMSLPKLLKLQRETDHHSPAYLSPIEASASKLPGYKPGYKHIAVTWSSAPHSEITEKKSIPYTLFRNLFDTPGCQFYSMQINADNDAVADMNRRSNVHDLR
ncbi:MAG: hypothetical protein ACKVKM_04790, partial [Verrucomicrobiia bacterium]